MEGPVLRDGEGLPVELDHAPCVSSVAEVCFRFSQNRHGDDRLRAAFLGAGAARAAAGQRRRSATRAAPATRRHDSALERAAARRALDSGAHEPRDAAGVLRS